MTGNLPLDPEPYVAPASGNRYSENLSRAVWQFLPREGYSQNEEDYSKEA